MASELEVTAAVVAVVTTRPPLPHAPIPEAFLIWQVDFSCLSCLKPLIEPMVLVPCGHSVCHNCFVEMEGAAGSGVLENAKFCAPGAHPHPQPEASCTSSPYRHPEHTTRALLLLLHLARPRHLTLPLASGPICNKMKRKMDAAPCEGFPNQMLDSTLSRMRTKHTETITNFNAITSISDDLTSAKNAPLPPSTLDTELLGESGTEGEESYDSALDSASESGGSAR